MFRSSWTRFLKDNDVIQALENHWITGKCSTCFSICCYCSVFAITALLKSEANGVARWIKTMIISSVMFSNTTGWTTPQHCFTEVRRCSLLYLCSDLLFAYWWWFKSKIQIYFLAASWKQFSRSIYDGSAEMRQLCQTPWKQNLMNERWLKTFAQ